MDRYARMAIEHWREFLPERFQELTDNGHLQAEANQAAEDSRREIRELREAGFQLHEAEEVVLPRYILLAPEADADDWSSLETPEDKERLSLQTGHYRDVARGKAA